MTSVGLSGLDHLDDVSLAERAQILLLPNVIVARTAVETKHPSYVPRKYIRQAGVDSHTRTCAVRVRSGGEKRTPARG
jgi:hypothetical protein